MCRASGVARVALVSIALFATGSPAGTILYVTGTTPRSDGQSRLYGYCVGAEGGLSPTPRVEKRTGGNYPRRLLVSGDVLYVAEVDRVEAYKIGPKGGLTLLNRTAPLAQMNPRDIAISDDGGTLYVPRRAQSQIFSYAVGANGFASTDADGVAISNSCVHQRTRGGDSKGPANWESLAVEGDKLYVTLANYGDGVRIYQLLPDGTFQGRNAPGQPDTLCPGNSDGVSPVSERSKLLGPRTLVVQDGRLYVQGQFSKRLQVFELTNGMFDPLTPKAAKDADVKQQKPSSRTAPVHIYDDIVLFKSSAILGSVFPRGRVDSFLLQDGGALPRRARQSTAEDRRISPLRIRADENTNTLYVPTGDLDNVQAFRLRADGTITSSTPFSQTSPISGSFPNDVIVATTSDTCD